MNVNNMNLKEIETLVKKIKYGYIDKSGKEFLGEFRNPDSRYFLQYPQQLLKSNIGLCFDIVELYRNYFHHIGLFCESYFMMYRDNDIIETHAFMIYKRKNNLWYECLDNTWSEDFYVKGYREKDFLLKNIYEWFQDYVQDIHGEVDKTKFYLNKYNYPKNVFLNKTNLISYCTTRDYNESFRAEFSGMAIVFCQDKVLVLQTKHNEFVFPKGHIESGESSKDAAIRECFEESGVDLKNAKYYGECGEYSYTFSAGHLKITNDSFYKTFEVSKITKTIYVHVFGIDTTQDFNLEKIFINGIWLDCSLVSKTITHDNTIDEFNRALELYKSNKNNA